MVTSARAKKLQQHASEGAAAAVPKASRDNERPLVEDIRLLGRILGDVIREQEGVTAYELIEQVRKLSVAFRRDADQEADKALKKLLKGLSGDQTVSVIRAFTYFSHLANLAEDRHHIRRRAEHERAGDTQEGIKALALAHNAAKDALTPRELAANEAQLRARVMQLWQTRLLRFSKLTVADEIENALSYYEATFLREIPKLYANLERELGNQPVHSFLRMGQWIGGDRDGNPNVSAETLNYALGRQAEVALRHYLTEVHFLGGELSQSAMLVDFSPEMRALAESSPDTSEHR
jgi:phosphoenolpyruvate carboxylase